VRVHPAAVDPLDRLGHERGEEAVAVGDVPDHELESGQVVRGGEHVGVAEIDLVLAGRHFVMGGLDLEPHLEQLLDDDAADLLAPVHRPEVEVRRLVVGDRGG
jgi:hypothetical protein